jgi:predicted nucleotidyltransferase
VGAAPSPRSSLPSFAQEDGAICALIHRECSTVRWDRATSMNRADVLKVLRDHQQQVRAQFGAQHLALFGSGARDELRDDSDIDVLVELEAAATLSRYFGLEDYLEALLGRPVDLVTDRGLKPRARRHVERDLIRVA